MKRLSAARVARDAATGAESIYVRLPLPPELVRALREHADNGARLVDLVTRANASVSELAEACARAGDAIERDVGRARRALKKRKRKR